MSVALTQDRPLYGAAMIVAGMAMIGVVDNCVRIIAEHAGLFQFHLMRTLMAVPLILVAARLSGLAWRPRRWGPALLRTGFVAGSMLLYFGALPAAPVAQVAAGLLTSPIWVLVLTAFVVSGTIGPRRVLAVAMGFAGVCLILRPWEAAVTPWSLAPLGAGLLYACGALATRRLCADEPPLALILLFFVAMGAAGAVGVAALAIWPQPELALDAPFFFKPPVWPLAPAAWSWIGLQAVASVVCVFLTTKGYQSADTSYVALFDYAFIVSAGLTGWVVWGDSLDATALAGIALVIAAGAFIALRIEQKA